MTAPPSRQARRRARQSRQAVELQIDALVLHGFAQTEAAEIAGAMNDELSRLAARPSSLAPGRANDVVADPYTPGTSRETGQLVAAAVFAGIQRQGGAR
jgi:hypothetical protein